VARIAAISARFGKAATVPARPTVWAAARAAWFSARASSRVPRSAAEASATAMKQSPAPVVSTTAQGWAGTRVRSVVRISSAPCAPSVRTISPTPCASRLSTPPSASASPSLRNTVSTRGQSVPKYGWSGEGLKAVRIPASRAARSAACVAAALRLPCSTRRSPVWPRASAAAAASGVSAEAASRVVMIAFSPRADMSTIEISVATPSSATSSASSGSWARRCAISCPRGPCPTAETKMQASPVRPIATAWLAPFPPRSRDSAAPKIEAPGRGKSSIESVSSSATLPMTKTFIPRSFSSERS
jgi:hypothetical protein